MEALTYIGNFVCDAGDGDDWHLKDHASHALELIALVAPSQPAQPAPGGEDRRDAERYRALRNGDDESAIDSIYPFSIWENTHWLKRGAKLDEAIDAMSPPPTSRPFTPEEHAAWERENGVGEAAKGAD